MIDGQFKQVLDILMANSGDYSKYYEIIRDIIFSGTSQLMESMKN